MLPFFHQRSLGRIIRFLKRLHIDLGQSRQLIARKLALLLTLQPLVAKVENISSNAHA